MNKDTKETKPKQTIPKQTKGEKFQNRLYVKIFILVQCETLHALIWKSKEIYWSYKIYVERMDVNNKHRFVFFPNTLNWKVVDLKKQWNRSF